MTRIGVISDTHGLVRDEVYGLFKDCDIILHAGDIGNYAVLKKLKKNRLYTFVKILTRIAGQNRSKNIQRYTLTVNTYIFFTIFKTWISSLKSSLTW